MLRNSAATVAPPAHVQVSTAPFRAAGYCCPQQATAFALQKGESDSVNTNPPAQVASGRTAKPSEYRVQQTNAPARYRLPRQHDTAPAHPPFRANSSAAA